MDTGLESILPTKPPLALLKTKAPGEMIRPGAIRECQFHEYHDSTVSIKTEWGYGGIPGFPM
jgi:hypothetical protein